MKNKLLIGAGILLTVFIIFLLVISGASGGDKIPTEETLKTIFSNVTCEVKNCSNIDYDLSLLTNNVEFDSQIQTKNYTKVKLNQVANFKSFGVVFILKSDYEISLNISLMKNDEVLKTTTANLSTNVMSNIDLLLENSALISATDDFYILFEQTTTDPFVFDTLITFIDEV
ncbi:MAG: hypothetical protein WCS10_07665 [Bacteroidales bacterium]|jgi:hypothetical protein